MKVNALSPIEHDGKPYEAGDALDVSEKDAKALIAAGVAEAAAGGKKAKGEDVKPPSEEA